MQKYYVLLVVDDIEPELRGPHLNQNLRDASAQSLKRTMGNQHGIFALDVDADGVPTVGAYSAGFLLDEPVV